LNWARPCSPLLPRPPMPDDPVSYPGCVESRCMWQYRFRGLIILKGSFLLLVLLALGADSFDTCHEKGRNLVRLRALTTSGSFRLTQARIQLQVPNRPRSPRSPLSMSLKWNPSKGMEATRMGASLVMRTFCGSNICQRHQRFLFKIRKRRNWPIEPQDFRSRTLGVEHGSCERKETPNHIIAFTQALLC
jgi:hypothetical protein